MYCSFLPKGGQQMKREYKTPYVISWFLIVASIYVAVRFHDVATGILLFIVALAIPASDKYMRGK